jgi:ActR/RegA family two-component response regulator
MHFRSSYHGVDQMCRILIVDDGLDFQQTLSGSLTDQGHLVCSTVNEAEALAAIAQNPFDFALVDVRLHGDAEDDESGLSLAIALRALKPEIRVILLTRYVRSKQIVRAMRYYGVLDFIEKTPDVSQQIAKVIQESDRVTPKANRPRLEGAAEPTRFSVSLAPTHPVVIRSHGKHVCSLRSGKALQVDVARYHKRVEIARHNPANLRFSISEIGDSLWKDLFAEHAEVSRAYTEARAKARTPLLLFETSRGLLDLPLEFIRSDDPAEYLVLQHPVARFICQATPRRAVVSPRMLRETDELRVLILSSNTGLPGTVSDIPGVDVEGKQLSTYLMTQSFIPVSAKFIPTSRATYELIRTELLEGHYDVVHYAGHGWFDAGSPEDSSLYFWSKKNRQGDVVAMKAAELKLLLEHTEVRLVYLSCCYGAAAGGPSALLDDDFLGVADAVAQAGVPSVVGFRWPVSDARAPKLALAFYKSLLEQGSPEIALWSARWELAAADRNEPTWLSPILIHQD